MHMGNMAASLNQSELWLEIFIAVKLISREWILMARVMGKPAFLLSLEVASRITFMTFTVRMRA